MDYAIIITASLLAGALTLITGFGLNTLLLPIFLILFPGGPGGEGAQVAVAAVAVVHLANSLFKVALVGRWADRAVVLRFGVPALLAAFAGAAVLAALAGSAPVATYTLAGRGARITPVGLTMGTLILLFAALELWPRFHRLALGPRLLPLGGVLSGFFGGLSGHQGALRSAFLLRAGLGKEAYVGTGTVLSIIVDVGRLAVYAAAATGLIRPGAGGRDYGSALGGPGAPAAGLLIAGCLAAFAGSYLGVRLLKKTTLRGVRLTVGVLLLLTGALLAAGLI